MRTFTAKIVLGSGGAPVEVTVEAHNRIQATNMVETIYGPTRILWVRG